MLDEDKYLAALKKQFEEAKRIKKEEEQKKLKKQLVC